MIFAEYSAQILLMHRQKVRIGMIKLMLYYKFGEYKELEFNELTALMTFLTDLMNRYGNGKEKLLLGYSVDLNY